MTKEIAQGGVLRADGSDHEAGTKSMISDAEINHPISNRYLPGVSAFVRAEPVWNWRSQRTPGLSGFDFRLFAGIRLAVNKPAYDTTINRIREQIKQYEGQLNPQTQLKSQAQPDPDQ